VVAQPLTRETYRARVGAGVGRSTLFGERRIAPSSDVDNAVTRRAGPSLGVPNRHSACWTVTRRAGSSHDVPDRHSACRTVTRRAVALSAGRDELQLDR
jgi:hypothetical protein